MIIWQPHAAPALIAGLLVVGGLFIVWLHRRLRPRLGRLGSTIVLAPKAAALALLVLALLDPSVPVQGSSGQRTLWLLLDQSDSMQLADAPGGSRQRRAEGMAEHLAKAAGDAHVERRWFDTSPHPTATTAPGRGTDLTACLQVLAPAVAASDAAGVVVLSDGGDEAVTGGGLPAAPIACVAIGGDPAQQDDAGIVALSAPETAEPGADIAIAVEAAARGSAAFRGRLDALPLVLSRQEADGRWRELERRVLDLRQGRVRSDLRVRAEAPGTLRLRAALAPAPGQLSALDDARTLTVEVRPRGLKVLYFSRSLGVEVKFLRGELARDPGVSFSAAYRTVGERFAVQGDPDPELADGLPRTLSRWDVVVLGAFPAADWRDEERKRLADWVSAGGGLALLGGDSGFGAGGYAGSALAPLFPWQIAAGEAPPLRGSFPIAIPAAAAQHPLVQGLSASGSVPARNRPGDLRPGATALVSAGAEPLVAVQGFGRGRVLGVATDALWRLPNEVYGGFWRGAVRWLSDRAEGGRGLRVRWDRARYRPGEMARGEVRVDAADAGLRAELVAPDGSRRDLAPEAAGAGSWNLGVPFAGRGTWTVRLSAGDASSERAFEIAPLLPEGARPGRDDEGLAELARGHGGVSAGEEDVQPVEAWVRERCRAPASTATRPLVTGTPWWLAALLACLVAEWWLRRRKGMI